MAVVINTITNSEKLSLINNNFTKLAAAINQSLVWRNGDTAGETAFTRDLDLNGYQILNAYVGTHSLTDMVDIAYGASDAATAAAASALAASASANSASSAATDSASSAAAAAESASLAETVLDSAVKKVDLASNDESLGASLVGLESGLTVQEDSVLQDLRSNTPIDIQSGAAQPAVFAQLVRTAGTGTQQSIDSFAVSVGSGNIYSLHETDDATQGIITRYLLAGGTVKSQVDVMSADSTVGHQGLSVEFSQGVEKLWVTYRTNPHSAMRFSYNAGGAPTSPEIYQLFEDSRFSPSSSCNPQISPDQRWITGFCLETGTQTVYCRVWDFQEMLTQGAGDHTTSFKYEFALDSTNYHPSGDVTTAMPVQGNAIDGENIYFWSGANGYATGTLSRRLHTYTLSGRLVSKNLNASVGATMASGDGSGISYEPEGAQVIVNNGSPALLIGVRSGSSLNPSVYRIWALGAASQKFFGPTVLQPPAGITAQILDRPDSGRYHEWRRIGTLIGYSSANTAAVSFFGYNTNIRLGNNNAGTETNFWEVVSTTGGFRPATDNVYPLGQTSLRISASYVVRRMWSASVFDAFGAGSPEGVLTAGIGSTYRRTDGGTSTTFYVKESGTGNTGWIAK